MTSDIRYVVRLPEVEIPERINKRAEPKTVAEAEEERRQLGLIHQRILSQIRDYHAGAFRDADWLCMATRKADIIKGRIQYLKAWKKTANRAAALHAAELACGGDLEDPVALVLALRKCVMRLHHKLVAMGVERPLSKSDLDIVAVAFTYGQIMATGDVEAKEADAAVRRVGLGAAIPSDLEFER